MHVDTILYDSPGRITGSSPARICCGSEPSIALESGLSVSFKSVKWFA